jgi:hypothetical protein
LFICFLLLIPNFSILVFISVYTPQNSKSRNLESWSILLSHPRSFPNHASSSTHAYTSLCVSLRIHLWIPTATRISFSDYSKSLFSHFVIGMCFLSKYKSEGSCLNRNWTNCLIWKTMLFTIWALWPHSPLSGITFSFLYSYQKIESSLSQPCIFVPLYICPWVVN